MPILVLMARAASATAAGGSWRRGAAARRRPEGARNDGSQGGSAEQVGWVVDAQVGARGGESEGQPVEPGPRQPEARVGERAGEGGRSVGAGEPQSRWRARQRRQAGELRPSAPGRELQGRIEGVCERDGALRAAPAWPPRRAGAAPRGTERKPYGPVLADAREADH